MLRLLDKKSFSICSDAQKSFVSVDPERNRIRSLRLRSQARIHHTHFSSIEGDMVGNFGNTSLGDVTS